MQDRYSDPSDRNYPDVLGYNQFHQINDTPKLRRFARQTEDGKILLITVMREFGVDFFEILRLLVEKFEDFAVMIFS